MHAAKVFETPEHIQNSPQPKAPPIKAPFPEPPENIVDKKRGKQYTRGQLLGEVSNILI